MTGSESLLDGVLRLVHRLRGGPDRRRPKAPTPRKRPGPDGYPGDFTARPQIVYRPRNDNRADPGEIVWTWVPYEEDHNRGKDRPVLLIGHDGPWLLGLQVTSQDHDLDADQEARAGRFWTDIGTGAWDPERRPSEARVNRIIRIDAGRVRRVGAILDEGTFNQVAGEVLRFY